MVDREPVADLRERGLRLWLDVTASTSLDESGLVLLDEACRLADRLDRMAELIDGGGHVWLELIAERGDDDVRTVVINGVMAEARQAQNALKNLMTEIRQLQRRSPRGVQGEGVPAGVSDLRDRIAKKQNQTAG